MKLRKSQLNYDGDVFVELKKYEKLLILLTSVKKKSSFLHASLTGNENYPFSLRDRHCVLTLESGQPSVWREWEKRCCQLKPSRK